MSLLFFQLSLFMTASAVISLFLEALVGSNAPGPVQKTEFEQTCTFAVSMLPIGSLSNG